MDGIEQINIKDILKKGEDDIIMSMQELMAHHGWLDISKIIQEHIDRLTEEILEPDNQGRIDKEREYQLEELRKYRKYLIAFKGMPRKIVKNLTGEGTVMIDSTIDPY